MERLVLSGYYGFDSIGDEAILKSVIFELKKISNLEIIVLSNDPKKTESRFGVRSINRKNIFKIISLIKNSNILLSGGGSILQDTTSNRSIVYYLTILFIGIILRKPTMIYSQGIGPIDSRINRILTKIILKKVNSITLRDNESKKMLIDMGIKKEKIHITTDPVFCFRKEYINNKYKSTYLAKSENKKSIGFCMRGKEKSRKFIDQMSIMIDKINNDFDVEIILIPFHYGEDYKFNSDIEKNSKTYVSSISSKLTVEETMKIVGELDILVGERLHSLIFATIMGVKMIPISYDPKVDSYVKYISEEVCLNSKDLDFETLYFEIEENLKLNNFEDQIASDIELDKLRNKLKINNKEVMRLLKRK